MRSAIIILSGWRFLSAFLRKKSPLGVFSRADPELSSYPFWLKLKMLSHPMWGYLSEYFRHLLSFSEKTLFSKQTLFKWRAETARPFCNAASGLSPGLFKNSYMVFLKTATWSGVPVRCDWRPMSRTGQRQPRCTHTAQFATGCFSGSQRSYQPSRVRSTAWKCGRHTVSRQRRARATARCAHTQCARLIPLRL